jgi:hypothetical protein
MVKKLLAESDVIGGRSDPFAGEHGRFPRGPVSGRSGHPGVNAPNSEQPERRRIAESRCATAQNRRDRPRFVFPAI